MEVLQSWGGTRRWKMGLAALLCMLLSGCIGAVVGTAVDVTLEVAKVPFKVAGAVIDVANPEDEDEE
jgi:hypothetical protein